MSHVLATKPYLLPVMSALIAIGPFTMEAYLPALPTIARELGVGIVDVNLSISTFLIGMSLGYLLGGPISDQLGRKVNALWGLSLFIAASVGISMSDDIWLIQILRLLQGIGSGFGTVVAMPTIRDVYEPEVAARKMPIVASVMMIAPLVGPAFGTVVMQWNWRYIFDSIAVLALLVLCVYSVLIPETRAPTGKLSFRRIGSQYRDVILHRVDGRLVGGRYILVASLSSGIFLVFLTNASWIYLGHYGISELMFPIYFGAHVFALMIANVAVSRLMAWLDPLRILLWSVRMQAVLIVLMLLLEARSLLHLPQFMVLLLVLLGLGSVQSGCVMAMLFGYFNRLTGSVASLMSFGRFGIGAALGFVSSMMFNHTIVPALATMALASVLCVTLALGLPRVTLKAVVAAPRPAHL